MRGGGGIHPLLHPQPNHLPGGGGGGRNAETPPARKIRRTTRLLLLLLAQLSVDRPAQCNAHYARAGDAQPAILTTCGLEIFARGNPDCGSEDERTATRTVWKQFCLPSDIYMKQYSAKVQESLLQKCLLFSRHDLQVVRCDPKLCFQNSCGSILYRLR